MKKSILLILTIILLINCKSAMFNSNLKQKGFYDEKISIVKLTKDQNEVVFIPMRHIGTELFYEDVKFKIDSLKKSGYYFYWEKIYTLQSDTILLRKARKLFGFPITKENQGFMHLIDSVYKFKLKKKIINQPSYINLGIESTNGRNVDVTLKNMIDLYESKYGVLELEPCDYETSPYEESLCNIKVIDEKIADEILLKYRNKNIVNELLKDKKNKIAIIYGAAHFIGIKEELLKLGYK